MAKAGGRGGDGLGVWGGTLARVTPPRIPSALWALPSAEGKPRVRQKRAQPQRRSSHGSTHSRAPFQLQPCCVFPLSQDKVATKAAMAPPKMAARVAIPHHKMAPGQPSFSHNGCWGSSSQSCWPGCPRRRAGRSLGLELVEEEVAAAGMEALGE